MSILGFDSDGALIARVKLSGSLLGLGRELVEGGFFLRLHFVTPEMIVGCRITVHFQRFVPL